MDRQHSSVFFFNNLSEPQRGKFSRIDDGLSPLTSRQDVYWGGEPMEITDSNGSTNSNMSRCSYVSTTTASSPITTYGSYETSSYMTGFNQPNSIPAEGWYAADGIDNSLQQMYLKAEAQESKISSGTTVHTPSTLGWDPNNDPYKFYLCVVPKNKKAPYLQLRAEFVANDITPFYVHLDEPINCQKRKFQCMYPGCYVGYKRPDDKKKKKKKGGGKNSSEQQADGDKECQKSKGPPSDFSRPADLDRHYLLVHSENKPEYPCDAHKCSRGAKNPFGRKDHLRDHLREYHRQDLGCAKREKKTNEISDEEIEAKWQRDQQTWIATRLIDPKNWRCNKCLTKTWVAINGWTCSNQKCNQPCEEERIQTRRNRLPGVEHTEEHHTEEPLPRVVHVEEPQPKVVVHIEEPQPEAVHPGEPFSWQSTAVSDYCFQCGNAVSVFGEFACEFCQASDESSNYDIDNYDYNLTLPLPLFTLHE